MIFKKIYHTVKKTYNNKKFKTCSKIFTHLTKQEKEKLYNLALSLPVKSVVVEIGSYVGASSCYLGLAAKKRNHKVYCVDTWQNDAMTEGNKDTFKEFTKNTLKFENFITPLKGLSIDMANNFDEQIDFMFFDGDHSYEGINSDFKAWFPKLKKNAIIVFHDIGWAEGVNKVIEENIELLQKNGNLPNMWFGQKK